MDLSLSPPEREFRDAVRDWIAANHPGPEPANDPAQFEFRRAWQRAVNERGWAGLTWPTDYGGAGGTLVEQAILFEEVARAGAPPMANILGLAMGGPTVIAHGSEEQRRRFLPPILSADEIWCQGFSEPESGSDLASLKTRAVHEGDEWVITGQKVWTTYAHEAKWCMLVARTDAEAPRHRGLTYFLMDMDQDGVEVRPLVQITGEAEFNELFIEGARIPHENIVGGEGNGWPVAITTLMHERAGLAFALQVQVQVALRELQEDIRAAGRDGDPLVRQRFGQLYAEAQVLRLNAYRGLTTIMKRGAPGAGGLAREVALGGGQPVADRAGDGRRRLPARRRALAAPLPARPRELDRGRDDRDPQEHRRRARARAPALMNFDLSDDQRTIKSTARELLAARYPLAEVRRLALEDERGFTDAQWDEMVSLGWPEIAELGTVEMIVVAEELGYALAPTPLQSTWVAGLLGADLSGAQRGAVVIDGLAADAGTADVLVDWDGAVVEGAEVEPVRPLDPTRRMFRVTGGSRSPAGGDVERARLQATVMNAAESVGVAERAMMMAVEYAKERKQFGRAIGTYQAVSHMCAQMLLEVEGARSAVYWAAWALDHEPETAALATACAKAYAGDAGRRVPRAAMQVHGGIGFTWEHDLHFFLKRGEANAHAYGSGASHRERIAALAGL